MARPEVLYSVANRGPVLTKSTFNNYDLCLNSYVGCEFGCTYCYVRFFVKDDQSAAKEGREAKPWGEFVRVREHITEKLPRELDRGTVKLGPGEETRVEDARLVLGTMTDPYQPAERKHRITRTALEIITGHSTQFRKVGIFTRSPIILDDLDLVVRLPKARVHFTVTPFPHDVMRKIEPISPRTERRWDVLGEIKRAGIRLHVNVSPVMPVISDNLVDEFAERLAELQPAEFFVDPMQPYKESFESFSEAMAGEGTWPDVQRIMTDRAEFSNWKAHYRQAWESAWNRYAPADSTTLPIWCDHVSKTWVDMRTGQQMDRQHYGDEAV